VADANGLRFWLLASDHDWTALPSAVGQPAPEYDERRRTFALGRYARVAFTETPGDAAARWSLSRTATDAHGTFAFYDPVSGTVRGTGSASGTVELYSPTVAPTDMTVGVDGVLYLIEANEIVLVDLRDRWHTVRLSASGFTPSRITSAGDEGIWILDRTNRRLAKVHGRPLPRRGLRVRAPDAFNPHEENPDPPRIVLLPHSLDANEDPRDLAASDGRIAVLLWRSTDEALVRFVTPEGDVSVAHVLGEIERPYSLGWIDQDTLAVIVAAMQLQEIGPPIPGGSEVVTYLADVATQAVTRPPLGGVYPMPGHDLAPFARGLSSPPRYAVEPIPGSDRPAPRKLVRVSATFRAPAGVLGLDDTAPLDSGEIGFVWHRAYLEAELPPSCGVRLFVGASDTFGEPPEEFFEHIFGDIDGGPVLPRGVWSTQPSELPFHPGLVPCPIVPHQSGLFSVLLQRTTRRVSAVAGRYLWVRLELEGNGHCTPEIAALRVYGSRFSYVHKYLPRVFHEQLVQPESDAPLSNDGPRSEADFLERFLCNFEGILTPLEDRIANAHLLTDPSTIPSESLDWLGSWIGFVFDPAYPDAHRREALRNTMQLHRWRGTPRGLQMAIDILTGGHVVNGEMVGGAVSNGQAVVLEGWRLRRTFATLLGVDLADEHDPLLGGVTSSGNSHVGDSLILSREHHYEFLALLRRTMPGEGPPAGAGVDQWMSWYIEEMVDKYAVQPFFDELAYRLVVLVHEDLDGDLVRLIERVAELEAPVHLVTEVSKATYPFMVGLASLVGVDTYLRAPVPKPKISVEQSRLGEGFLSRPAALDTRLEGGHS
jgi:phage tail-like protein